MAENANKNGKLFESIIAHILRQCKIPFEHQYNLNVYGYDGNIIRTDFHIHETKQYPEGFFIEAKWQSSSGSASQKLYIVCENIKRYYPKPGLLIAEGKAIIKARSALKSQVEGNLIDVFSLREFIEFCLMQCDEKIKISIPKNFESRQMNLPI